MSSEATRPSNFEITYENYIFTFISKFTTVQDYQLVFLTSTKMIDSIKSTDPADIKELIFARSKSECGFWRLCTASPENVGNNFYLEKGPQYTMSSFIIIELQLYLDSILDDLPIDESPQEDKRFCQQNFFEIYDAINNRPRMIDNDEFGLDLNFNILTFRDDLINTDSILLIGDYNYEGKLNNFYQISKRDTDIREKIRTHYTETNLERKSALEEELKTKWPSRFSDIRDIDSYPDINYGITNISLHGKIYSIEFKDRNYKLYYMIYNCRIVVPEDINKYQNSETNLEYRTESVEAEQLIIPIYIIPKRPLNMSEKYGTTGLRRDIFTKYGLYNYYINSKYDGKDLKTSKFFDYIQQCRTRSEGKKPTCTTQYKFMGYYFDEIPFLSMIKSKTLEKNARNVDVVGGKKQKKSKKSNKTKKKKTKNRKKTKKSNKKKKTKKSNKN